MKRWTVAQGKVNGLIALHLIARQQHARLCACFQFGNPLQMAAAKAALTEVLTPEAYDHTARLGSALADGIEASIEQSGLPWATYRFGPRAGQWYGPAPATSRDAVALIDHELTRLLRVWTANRGIWEALPGAGPTVPVPATADDVDRYLEAYVDLLVALTS